MAKTPRVLPDLSNATPTGLLEMIFEARKVQKDGKFDEGIYRQKLDSMWPEGETKMSTEKLDAEIIDGFQERIDVEVLRAEFSREELIIKGWLKTIPTKTLKIKEKE